MPQLWKFLLFFFIYFLPQLLLSSETWFPQKKKQTYTNDHQEIFLIELFTSEGCSSCPPADKWMNQLEKHPKLWTRFIPLKWHVDYWNYLGWKDPLSNADYTNRQKQYSKEWKSSTIYTPGFVFDGKEGKSSFSNKISQKQKKKLTIGKLQAIYQGKGQFLIEFLPQKLPYKNIQINMALLGSGISNKVTRGENRGRKLSHNFVVLDYKNQEVALKKSKFQIKMLVQKKNSIKTQELFVVFWINLPQNLKPIMATGGPIHM